MRFVSPDVVVAVWTPGEALARTGMPIPPDALAIVIGEGEDHSIVVIGTRDRLATTCLQAHNALPPAERVYVPSERSNLPRLRR